MIKDDDWTAYLNLEGLGRDQAIEKRDINLRTQTEIHRIECRQYEWLWYIYYLSIE